MAATSSLTDSQKLARAWRLLGIGPFAEEQEIQAAFQAYRDSDANDLANILNRFHNEAISKVAIVDALHIWADDPKVWVLGTHKDNADLLHQREMAREAVRKWDDDGQTNGASAPAHATEHTFDHGGNMETEPRSESDRYEWFRDARHEVFSRVSPEALNIGIHATGVFLGIVTAEAAMHVVPALNAIVPWWVEGVLDIGAGARGFFDAKHLINTLITNPETGEIDPAIGRRLFSWPSAKYLGLGGLVYAGGKMLNNAYSGTYGFLDSLTFGVLDKITGLGASNAYVLSTTSIAYLTFIMIARHALVGGTPGAVLGAAKGISPWKAIKYGALGIAGLAVANLFLNHPSAPGGVSTPPASLSTPNGASPPVNPAYVPPSTPNVTPSTPANTTPGKAGVRLPDLSKFRLEDLVKRPRSLPSAEPPSATEAPGTKPIPATPPPAALGKCEVTFVQFSADGQSITTSINIDVKKVFDQSKHVEFNGTDWESVTYSPNRSKNFPGYTDRAKLNDAKKDCL